MNDAEARRLLEDVDRDPNDIARSLRPHLDALVVRLGSCSTGST